MEQNNDKSRATDSQRSRREQHSCDSGEQDHTSAEMFGTSAKESGNGLCTESRTATNHDRFQPVTAGSHKTNNNNTTGYHRTTQQPGIGDDVTNEPASLDRSQPVAAEREATRHPQAKSQSSVHGVDSDSSQNDTLVRFEICRPRGDRIYLIDSEQIL